MVSFAAYWPRPSAYQNGVAGVESPSPQQLHDANRLGARRLDTSHQTAHLYKIPTQLPVAIALFQGMIACLQ